MAAKTHPTAIVHPEAVVHESCEVGPYCIIGPKVKLGPSNKLLSHVVMESRTTVGESNIFHPFSVIGGAPQDLKYRDEPTELVIGSHNTIRESVSLNIGTAGGGGLTKIGDYNLIMSCVHIGHDTIVGDRTVIAGGCQIAGHVKVEDWAIIGGLTGVAQFIRIGAHSYVGGCSGVDRDVPPFSFGRGPTGGYEVMGMNLVGLKRRGFADGDISTLQEINKVFFKDKSLEKEAALRKIEELFGASGIAQQFLKFVRGSEKGIYR